MSESIVIIGGGGHAKVLIDCIESIKTYEIYGIIDPGLPADSLLGDISVLGGDDKLAALGAEGYLFALGIGMTKSTSRRKTFFLDLKKKGFRFPFLVHSSSTVSSRVMLGEGVQIMAGAVIQPFVEIDENAVINTGALIDHDCRIGAHSHVAPGAILGGEVRTGECCHIGLGAKLIQGITLGNNVTVGSGAVVLENIPDDTTVVGVPAKSV